MKGVSILWFFFFMLASFSVLVADDPASAATVHTLTWIRSIKETGLSKDHPNGCELILDGKNLGLVDEVMPFFEKMPLTPEITFRITYPDDSNLHKEHYYPAYAMTNFIPLLVSSGVHLEFYFKGKQCDIRTYWWDLKDRSQVWEEAEFFLDGVSLGMGLEAQKKLGEVKWGYEPTMLYITFTGKEYPYRGYDDAGSTFPYQHPYETLYQLGQQKVRKEIYQGIAPHPIYVPPAQR